ncbi:MAG: beta strand repeat-containing protein, partial [Dehalococcoidia bacterium]
VLVTTPSGTNGANTLFTYVTSTSSQFSFSAATYNTTEGATLSVTVVRSGLLTQDAGVTLTFSNGTAAYGTDFQPQGGSPSLGLTFGGTTSQTQATVLVNILSNSLSTSDTQFTMTLTAGGTNTVVAPFTATVNINDIHGPQTPSVTNLSQHSGPTGGGNQVVISGVHFTGVICPSGVLFGGQPATACTVNSDASITATAPAGSGTVNVRVTNLAGPSPDAGAADDYTYGAGPVVTSLSPNNGPASGGNTVVLSGTGFGSSPTVRFNGVVATIVGTATNTSITVFAPANSAGTVASVIVTASAVQSPDVPESRYTYNTGTGTGVPAISTISPASGTTLGGTPVTISGTNLTGTTGVTFDGLAASLQAVTAAAVNVLTPAHAAGAVNVVLLNPNGNVTRNSAYQFTTGPTVTGLSPRGVSLNADATVQITGTGFVSGATTVQFGSTNIPAGSVTFISAQQISVQAPQSTIVTTVDVRVTTAAGQSPNTPDDDFSYGSSSPGVTAISPNSGPTSGGNIVTVNGLNFIGTVTVQFGLGNFGTEVTLVNAGQLTVKAPGRALGTVSLFVTTNAGTSADTAADDYTYTNAPSITSLSPTSGLPGATTLVDITGTNLLGATSVKFGTVAAETYTVLSNVLIRVAVPGNLVAGIYDVTVTGPGGISAVSAQTKFTVGGSGPAVTSLSPNTAPINNSTTTVAITGVNFAAPATVSFGGVAATNVVVVNSTRITVTAPSRSTNGTVDVIVSTTAGSSPGAGTGNDFTYGSTQTATYTLSFRWTLITWTGRANIGIAQALQGLETPDNAATNNVTSQVTAVFKWSPNGAGCGAGQLTCWLAYFPAGTGVPGANDISTLENGTAYWIAVVANVSWTVISGP